MQKLFKIHTWYREEEIYSTFKLITRLAYLLSTEGVIIPASNYFESDISFKIINELSELNVFGVFKLASSSSNLDELLDKKNIQHALKNENNQHHYGDFRNRGRVTPLYLPASLVSRQRSASEDITTAWHGSIDSSDVWPDLYKAINVSIPIEKFENIIQSVPDLLGDNAFISEYILPLLPPKASNLPEADRILNLFITKHYIESFLNEYDAMCFTNIPIIDYNQVLPNSHNSSMYIPYNIYAQKLHTVIFKACPKRLY